MAPFNPLLKLVRGGDDFQLFREGSALWVSSHAFLKRG